MSIATEIARIQTARNTIRTKLNDLSLVPTTADIEDCAAAVSGIENRGAVQANVQEGDTYTIPKGYHNGSGTVSGVAGGGNYSLQEKSVTPTKQQQSVTADSGYYGMSSVTVAPIPEAYQDVTPVTAAAADVLANKIIVDKTGKSIAGTMPNNGAVSKTLDTAAANMSYTIPAGYHNGAGKVQIVTEEKTNIEPKKETVVVTPTAGKVLSKVSVAPIPDEYQDVSNVTATADTVLEGSQFVNENGELIEGTIPIADFTDTTLSVSNTSVDVPEGYHEGASEVKITLEEKSATPTKAKQEITPTAGKVLSKVTVNAIPSNFADISSVDATEQQVLEGYTFVGSDGVAAEGGMPNNGSATNTIDGLTLMSVEIPAGYTTGGTISLTNDIETQLAAI